MDSRTIDLAGAAILLGVSRSLAYALVARGQFPVEVLRLGRRLVVPRAPLERLLGVEALNRNLGIEDTDKRT